METLITEWITRRTELNLEDTVEEFKYSDTTKIKINKQKKNT